MLRKLEDGKSWVVEKEISKIEVFISERPKSIKPYRKIAYIVNQRTQKIESYQIYR